MLLLHPEVATRDCGHCQKWLYDEKTGRVVKRGPRDVERPAGTFPPCQTQAGCPKGTPEEPRSLSPRNEMAYRHYLECKAVGEFPPDSIVRRNAALIRATEDSIAGAKQDAMLDRLGLLGAVTSAIVAAGRSGHG